MRGVALILYYTKLLKNNQKLFNYLVLPQIHPPPKGRGFLCALWVKILSHHIRRSECSPQCSKLSQCPYDP